MGHTLNVTAMSPAEGRAFWTALMGNAVSLVEDADLLLRAGSCGRARSLTVLAQEEVGKALWIYETFRSAWNVGSIEPLEVKALDEHGTRHVRKYMEAHLYGEDLPAFWGDFESAPTPRYGESYQDHAKRREEEAEAAARQANTDKQTGFYVDRTKSGLLSSPVDVTPGTISEDLRVAAKVIQMLLISDHSRMKIEAATDYDSTGSLQYRLLRISDPEDWALASDDFRSNPSD